MPSPRTERQSRRVYTVLVADDDEQIRQLVWELLSIDGFRVLPARNGHEALDILGKQGDSIDVVLADVVMPRIGGRELAVRALKLLPHLKILFMSGYGDNADLGGEFPDAVVLEKPFTADQLGEAVWLAVRKRG